MPEWPEMERYRRLLGDKIAGHPVQAVEITRAKSINLEEEPFIRQTVGCTVWFVERRGKHLLFHLDNGKRLLLHLMLGGLLQWGTDEEKPERTVQITLRFPHGNLYMIGLRLGYLHLLSVKEAEERLSDLGPEPLDKHFTFERFRARFAGKRTALKTALVDQQVIAGIGNCYADEICFKAGVHPAARTNELKESDWQLIYSAMHLALQEALEAGGYMEAPFAAGDELTGGANDTCSVYDREGEACRVCGTKIEKRLLSSRKLFYCPRCQPEE